MSRRLASVGVLSLLLVGWPGASSAQDARPFVAPSARTETPPKTPATRPPVAVAPARSPAAPTAVVVARPSTPDGTVERARRGVVVLERAGTPLGLGVVLDGDGRILTALSPLSHGNFVTVRYHDGSQSPVRLVHSDRAWDLALLRPEKSDLKAGLRATKAVGLGGLQLLTLSAPPNTVAAAPAALKPAPPLLGGDGRTLTDAFELGTKPAYVGAPIVNADGDVVALVARACPAGKGAGCVPTPYGVPVSALKQFLRRVPAEATWLGIQVAADERDGVRGLRVVSLTAGPAAAAGVRGGKDAVSGDLIIAVDGTPVTSPAELTDAISAHAVGDNVELLLYGMRRYRHVSLTPRPAPELTTPPYAPTKPVRPKTPNPYR